MRTMKRMDAMRFLGPLVLLVCATECFAQTTVFNYQGRLTEAGGPASGTYEMQFKLFDAPEGGTQQPQATPVTLTFAGAQAIPVANGVFTVQLDFGANAFPGVNRYLEIGVRHPGETSFTLLSPRQQLTSTPYAVRALSAAAADTATNSQQLGGTAADQFVRTDDARLSDARSPASGSGNYVQNTTTQQASSNFNVSGNGTAGGTLSGNTVNTATQYNLGGRRVLGAAGSNLFVGIGAGQSNTIGNTMGNGNSFVGANAGINNTFSFDNSFFGASAGEQNTLGFGNTFVGGSVG